MSQSSQIRVLLFDTHHEERALIEELLIKAGCGVAPVSSEQECMVQLESDRYDLVIFDQNTPGLDTEAFVSRLDEVKPLTPVAMMVTMKLESYEDKYGQTNIDFLVSKPFGYGQVLRLVQEASAFSHRLEETNPDKKRFE